MPWLRSRAAARPPRLVLGCNGYLGRNLLPKLDPERFATTSASPPPPGLEPPHFVRCDLSRSPRPLLQEPWRELYVLSRPPTNDWAPNARFYENLKQLLLAASAREPLDRVVLASTQLVYGRPDALLTTDLPVRPEGHYEYFKCELELFLAYLVHVGRIRSASSHRLPLLFGGQIGPGQRRAQLLYAFLDAIRSGRTWSFGSEEERRYGSSWGYTPDVAEALLGDLDEGFTLHNPTSGFVAYADFQEIVQQLLAAPPSAAEGGLHLPASRYELAPTLPMPGRSLREVCREALA